MRSITVSAPETKGSLTRPTASSSKTYRPSCLYGWITRSAFMASLSLPGVTPGDPGRIRTCDLQIRNLRQRGIIGSQITLSEPEGIIYHYEIGRASCRERVCQYV